MIPFIYRVQTKPNASPNSWNVALEESLRPFFALFFPTSKPRSTGHARSCFSTRIWKRWNGTV